MFPIPPPEFPVNLSADQLKRGSLLFVAAVSGLFFAASTAGFAYNGLRGAQESMDSAGTLMYVTATIGSAALYALNRTENQPPKPQ